MINNEITNFYFNTHLNVWQFDVLIMEVSALVQPWESDAPLLHGRGAPQAPFSPHIRGQGVAHSHTAATNQIAAAPSARVNTQPRLERSKNTFNVGHRNNLMNTFNVGHRNNLMNTFEGGHTKNLMNTLDGGHRKKH